MSVPSLAERFVDLASCYDWKNPKELPAEVMQTLQQLVLAAGFDSLVVVPGELYGHYNDQDGSWTGETYRVNRTCAIKVVNQENENEFFATGWLDSLFCRVIVGKDRDGESRDQLIEVVQKEITRSLPLPLIMLTSAGDVLVERLPQPTSSIYPCLVDHTRDEQSLDGSLGVHEYCRGWMDRFRATKTHDALLCRKCYLRVLFPREIKTYGELRKYLQEQIRLAKARLKPPRDLIVFDS
ncbi:MAG: hypothetical protein NTU97_00605 [Candidatus Magasanikbacteria bacterium]|nr:hypothetical protein [Candidatus Magasanikbacteria bacterium]